MVLDATNPAAATPTVWRWAFAVLGGGGLIATLAAYGLRHRTPASETG